VQLPLRRLGLDLTPRHFYSPIPPDLSGIRWDRRSELRGIPFDLDEQMRWVRGYVAPYADEFQPPIQIAGYDFRYANESFGHGDADVLYGAIRSRKPHRIVELGSGNSSVVIRLALQRNATDGHACAYDTFDPYPNDHLAGTPMALTASLTPAEQVPDSVFSSLGDGDILFVDTTHTVRIGGDVVSIVLDSLPLLNPGVLVHFHDIPMPYEYSRGLIDNGFYWAEQYLLQAFLAFNESFRVRAGLRALSLERRDELAELIPSIVEGAPISLWLERIV
jgi:hypothetical protein